MYAQASTRKGRSSSIERVERRALLAATAAIDLRGVLQVAGTDAAEEIAVRYDDTGSTIGVYIDGVLLEAFPPVYRIVINAGAGNDRVLAQTRRKTVVMAGDGDDTVLGVAGADVFYGEAGNDLLQGGSGYDSLLGGDGNDTLLGDGGGGGLWGNAGDDSIIGGSSDEMLFGGAGNDTLLGLAGRDVLYPGTGIDWIDGGSDVDSANYSFENTNASMRLSLDGIANDGAVGANTGNLIAVEDLGTGDGDDILIGNGHANRLDAGKGNDTIYGLGGDDTIDSGWGVNLVDAGTGNDVVMRSGIDTIYGGAGDDAVESVAGGGTARSRGRCRRRYARRRWREHHRLRRPRQR
ncbi:MAG: calcium-binding protein [Tepidisphaeraceae bacterium]